MNKAQLLSFCLPHPTLEQSLRIVENLREKKRRWWSGNDADAIDGWLFCDCEFVVEGWRRLCFLSN
ncbi:hypothetical protein PRUPE_3G133400 [Prunus persica]|uniref:Uncharacterized protein n=1 Tax=Prunus persica TaxID=3760 RepID=A0A251PZL0_PRUPE|nr:hypothetical protein PRUPE_3G133400 [Prunus persica]